MHLAGRKDLDQFEEIGWAICQVRTLNVLHELALREIQVHPEKVGARVVVAASFSRCSYHTNAADLALCSRCSRTKTSGDKHLR